MTTPSLLVTWTIYGTFLPGDKRGWRHRSLGQRAKEELLEAWHRDKLRHYVLTLSQAMRHVVENAIHEVARIRNWTVWAVAARSNHVHVVITAPDVRPTLVRDQLKSQATRRLRLHFLVWRGRPVWSAKGDIQYLDTDEALERRIQYVLEAQDRKGRDK